MKKSSGPLLRFGKQGRSVAHDVGPNFEIKWGQWELTFPEAGRAWDRIAKLQVHNGKDPN